MFTSGMSHETVQAYTLPTGKIEESKFLKYINVQIMKECGEYKHGTSTKSLLGFKGYELHGFFKVQYESELLL